jgi:8-oxo-dGTP pyrophosphatase MutT (NUDIX family)
MAPLHTIDYRCRIFKSAAVFLAVVILCGCEVYATAPPCPFAGLANRAPSAGCFSVENGKLLVVQDLNGRLTPPGGSARAGESAQCAAYRETWEETGLYLLPMELLEVFDTGFHLYRCERIPGSGDIDPPARFEVRGAFYLPPTEFEAWEWRFAGQQDVLRVLLERVTVSGR